MGIVINDTIYFLLLHCFVVFLGPRGDFVGRGRHGSFGMEPPSTFIFFLLQCFSLTLPFCPHSDNPPGSSLLLQDS